MQIKWIKKYVVVFVCIILLITSFVFISNLNVKNSNGFDVKFNFADIKQNSHLKQINIKVISEMGTKYSNQFIARNGDEIHFEFPSGYKKAIIYITVKGSSEYITVKSQNYPKKINKLFFMTGVNPPTINEIIEKENRKSNK